MNHDLDLEQRRRQEEEDLALALRLSQEENSMEEFHVKPSEAFLVKSDDSLNVNPEQPQWAQIS